MLNTERTTQEDMGPNVKNCTGADNSIRRIISNRTDMVCFLHSSYNIYSRESPTNFYKYNSNVTYSTKYRLIHNEISTQRHNYAHTSHTPRNHDPILFISEQYIWYSIKQIPSTTTAWSNSRTPSDDILKQY